MSTVLANTAVSIPIIYSRVWFGSDTRSYMVGTDTAHILSEELKRRQASNSKYSLNTFAKQLSLSPASLSEILSRKRKVTLKTIMKISKHLEFTPSHTLRLANTTFRKQINAPDLLSDEGFSVMPDDEFALISEWHHFAIMHLGETVNNQANPEWISERLGISVDAAKQAFERLVKMGLVKQNNDDSYVFTSKPVTLTSDVPQEARRKYQKQVLDLAKERLDQVDVNKREYASMTMAIDPDLLPVAKTLLKQCRREISSELEKGNRREVYLLNMQLFPISK